MKNLRNMGLAVGVLLAVASCQSEETLPVQQVGNLSIEARMGADTRTAVDNGGVVTWTEGDAMLVYGPGVKGTLTLDAADAGKTTGTFRGNVQGDANDLTTAVYPAAAWDAAGTTVTLGTINYPNSNAPMVADFTPGETLGFQHLCGMVRINIFGLGEDDVVKVIGTGIGGTATLSGKELTVSAPNAEQTITVNGAKAVENIDVPIFAGGTVTKIMVNDAVYTLDGIEIEIVKGAIKASDIPTLVYSNEGGTESLEPATDENVENLVTEAVDFAKVLGDVEDGGTLYVKDVEVSLVDVANILAGKDITIEGVGSNNVLNAPASVYAKGGSLTLKNVTYATPAGLSSYQESQFGWIHRIQNLKMVGCTVERLRLNVYGTATFEDCTFVNDKYNGFDGYCFYYYANTGSKVTMKNCTFDTAGKAIIMYNEGSLAFDLTVEECIFTSSNSTTDKAAVQMHTEYDIYGTLTMNKCKATGFVDENDGLWYEVINEDRPKVGYAKGTKTCRFTKIIDGVTVETSTVLQGE